MTVPRQCRGKRLVAAAVAAVLMASVLAVVTGAPIQAANTSGEELIDTDGDGKPDSREFAGAHRYNTAVALAERFAADEGSISTVIIASGETQVDAVTSAGLAGNLTAPVLLTRSHQLPHNVGRFIDEHNITDVVVVGGTAAVPDAIVTAIEGLASRPTVERVSGADRYATAAAIGSRLGGPHPTWCGSTQTAAIVVNGGEAGRADAIVAGPLAFRLGLPVLLTAADELPEATRMFLAGNKVERVVVVGGESAVSAGVVDTLIEDVGVVNVQRIAGDSAAATSVAVAAEMLGHCADVLGTNPDLVALVNRDATADGIAAAPVLGRGLGDGGSVPILLVGDDLPAAVSDYLASTPEVRSGVKTHLSILAIGGTAVVSDPVMADAVAAAKTSSALTATITPLKYTASTLIWAQEGVGAFPAAVPGAAAKSVGDYEPRFQVTFSDDVRLAEDGDDANSTVDAAERVGTVEDPTMYRLNGRRIAGSTADGGATDEPVRLLDLVYTADRTVTITLSHHLEAGDTITVDNSANEAKGSRLGANGDRRTLEPASLTLAPVVLAADRNAPVVEVLAVPGTARTTFDIVVVEPNILHSEIVQGPSGSRVPGTNLTEFVSVDGRGARTDPVVQSAADTPARRKIAHARYRVTLSAALEHGDVIVIERNAVLDRGGRGNPLIRYRVPKVKTNTAPPAGTGSLEILSVSIGDVTHGDELGGGHASASILTDALIVTAKATGVASGARGNEWRIFGYDDRADGATSTNAFTIRTAVDVANQRISYTISDALPIRPHRQATIGDLAAALASNSDFAANFWLRYFDPENDAKSDPLGATSAAGAGFVGGVSYVDVIVKFNNAIAALANDGEDLVVDIAPRLDRTATPPDDASVIWEAPDSQVRIAYNSTDVARLPARAGFRVIAAGVATGYPDTTASLPATQQVSTAVTNVREILNSLRPDASIRP